MRKATACQVCGAEPERGAYCRPCWRKHEYVLRTGSEEGYRPYTKFVEGMECPDCGKPIIDKHPNFIACRTCGVKHHRKYQRDLRESRRKRPANNPIIVNPKKHMAPPAPKIEVKPERVVVPAHITVTRIPLNISRWEHGGMNLFND